MRACVFHDLGWLGCVDLFLRLSERNGTHPPTPLRCIVFDVVRLCARSSFRYVVFDLVMGYCSGMAFRKAGKVVGVVIGVGKKLKIVCSIRSISPSENSCRLILLPFLAIFLSDEKDSWAYRRRRIWDTLMSTGIKSETMPLDHWTWYVLKNGNYDCSSKPDCLKALPNLYAVRTIVSSLTNPACAM